MAQWRCRLCGFERYHRVAVLKKNGQRYETTFFACSGCSVMFLNDSTFNGLHVIAATPIAGLAEIYAVVRSMGITLAHSVIEVDRANVERFVHLAKLLNDSGADEVAKALEAAKEKLKRGQVRTYIRLAGQSVIAIVATYKLLAATL